MPGYPHDTDQQPRSSGTATLPALSVQEIRARLEAGGPLMLLDVREPHELLISHLDQGVNIPLSQMADRWQEIPRDRPVVVFCRSGARSANLIAELQSAGYTNLINMTGGINAWSREIDPSIPRY